MTTVTNRQRFFPGHHTRREDERDLAMLWLRDNGVSQTMVAGIFGISVGAVAGIYRRVRLDLAESEAAE